VEDVVVPVPVLDVVILPVEALVEVEDVVVLVVG